MPDKLDKSYSDRLSSIARNLRKHVDDEGMLREIHAAMQQMLSSGDTSEQAIRSTLQRQFDGGALRAESFALISQLIDRVSAGAGDTIVEAANDELNALRRTAVIDRPEQAAAPADRQLQVGSVLRDRYLLHREVAGGSMGTVYKAMDRRLAETDADNHWVAIKVLHPQLSRNGNALRALQQEAAKTRCLSHPNIVRFIDLDRDDDLYFIVMEWLDGRSLSDILNDSSARKIDYDTALDIIKQLAGALEHAHQRGIVHADVKPGNIMITPDGMVKLFDFGVARVLQKQRADARDYDRDALKAATPAYSSMQVLTGEEPVPADDVFSLACLAYRLLAGYRVFGPRNAAEAAEAGMEPQPIAALGNARWKVLKKALSFARVTRYASPADFIRAFTSTARETTADNTLPTVELPEVSERSVAPYVIVVLLVGLLATGWYLGWHTQLMHIARSLSETAATSAPTESENEAPSEATNPDSEAQSPPAPAEPVTPVTDTAVSNAASGHPAVAPVEAHSEGPLSDGGAAGASDNPALTPSEDPPANPLPDFASMPAPTMIIPLPGVGEPAVAFDVTLMEDGEPAIVDFVRKSNVEEPMVLRVRELDQSGNDSPWQAGQYSVSDDGLIRFAAGQHRARSTLSMASDPVREPDRDVVLVVLDAEHRDVRFATISLTLRDDDQRAFENGLSTNTFAFAASQVSVRERDSAVQIDVIRHKADDRAMEISYTIQDVTAKEGEDYFDPGSKTISFAPRQRTARILIPLVQDTVRESDEAFLLELTNDNPPTNAKIYRRIAVMIRDDDS